MRGYTVIFGTKVDLHKFTTLTYKGTEFSVTRVNHHKAKIVLKGIHVCDVDKIEEVVANLVAPKKKSLLNLF